MSGCLFPEDIKSIRKSLKLSQKRFAQLLCVSLQTISRWEQGKKEITGPAVTLCRILALRPGIAQELAVPVQETPVRLMYYKNHILCTVIDVDDRLRKVVVKNYTERMEDRAFGVVPDPSYEQYRQFLASRCFPPERDKIKIELKKLNIPFYDPFMIIEKTEGRVEGDPYRIEVIRI